MEFKREVIQETAGKITCRLMRIFVENNGCRNVRIDDSRPMMVHKLTAVRPLGDWICIRQQAG